MMRWTLEDMWCEECGWQSLALGPDLEDRVIDVMPVSEHLVKATALEAEVRLLQAQKLEWNQRAVQERERYERLRADLVWILWSEKHRGLPDTLRDRLQRVLDAHLNAPDERTP